MSLVGGKAILTLPALSTAVGAFFADWNHTHLYNPRWPEHARFHDAQTMSFGAVLGVTALWLLWGATGATEDASSLPPAARALLAKHQLRAATFLSAVYWITQASAAFYPGCLCVDIEFGTGCPQFYIDGVLLTCCAIGYWVASAGMAREAEKGRGNKAK